MDEQLNMSLRDLDRLNLIRGEIAKLTYQIYELQKEEDKIWNKYNNKIVIRRHKID